MPALQPPAGGRCLRSRLRLDPLPSSARVVQSLTGLCSADWFEWTFLVGLKKHPGSLRPLTLL